MEDQTDRDAPAPPSQTSVSPPKLGYVAKIEGYLHACKAKRDKETSTERAERRTANATWTIAGLTVVIAAAGFAQWHVQGGTLEEMRAEQRPVIWTSNNLGGPAFYPTPGKSTGQVYWTLHFTNYGHGFVGKGTAESFIKVGKREFQKSYSQSIKGDGLSPLATNQDQFLTAVSDPGIELAEFNSIMQPGAQDDIRIKFIFKYFDLGDGFYETGVCLRRTNVGAISYCQPRQLCKIGYWPVSISPWSLLNNLAGPF